jgi:ATP-dependent exoDNAse (exonuclease V) alpha subunit
MTQKDALDILKLGQNIFLTGPAGSGKTTVINTYIQYLKEHKISVGVTASTGIAATHLNGRTIHAWSGMGIKDQLSDGEIRNLLTKTYLQTTILKAKVLIIDEVSMLHGFRLDIVDRICKAFKKNDLPFGGLQVILCGDLFQLPPVSKYGEIPDFAHKSQIWQEMNIKICYLHEQHRQEDRSFLRILNDIRNHRVDEETQQLLLQRYNQPIKSNITPTKLYVTNKDVDAINTMELEKLQEKPEIFLMASNGIKDLVDTLKKNCLAPETLVLKKNAVVMFVKNNFNKGYVNGTLGKIIGFDESNYPIVETFDKQHIIATPEKWAIDENEMPIAEISQIPLRLAWAITIHKSQGMTLDAAQIDLSKSFTEGMGYVALSRVRSLAGIKLMGINEMAFQVNKEIIEFDEELLQQSQYAEAELQKISLRERKNRHKQFIAISI